MIYYGDWSIWGGQENFYPKDIPGDQLTHLNFAFLDFDSSGNLVFTDTDAAVGAPVGMDGVSWGDANAGVLSAFQELRANNPNLRIGVSVGGWSKSGDFSVVAANSATRRVLVDSLMKFIKYENLDFVDIDWEYPNLVREPDLVDNSRDEGTPRANAADKENYIRLLQDLRDALDAQGTQLNKKYELTVALPADPNKLDAGIDVAKVFEIVDFANVMTYDLYGGWSSFSGHHTGLYNNPANPDGDNQFSVENAVNYILARGVDPSKLVVGVAFYTRGWYKVNGLFGEAQKTNTDADGTATYGGPNEAPLTQGDGGRAGGVWAYRSLSKLKSTYSLTEYWDDVAKAPYLYNPSSGLLFTYDNAQSINEKAKYVQKNGLGGLITWMASEDAPTSGSKRDELTKVIKTALFGSAALPKLDISPAAVNASLKVTTYTENGREGYEITLTNTAKKDESQTVLALVELAGETIKLPKLYIKTKSNSTFATGGYGSGTVTNENGVGIVDIGSVYDNKMIAQGVSVTFRLVVTGTVDKSDIVSIELSQRISASGVEISRQVIGIN